MLLAIKQQRWFELILQYYRYRDRRKGNEMSDKLWRMGEVVMGEDEVKTLLGRPEMNGRLGLIFTFIFKKQEGDVDGKCVTDRARINARSYLFLHLKHDCSLVYNLTNFVALCMSLFKLKLISNYSAVSGFMLLLYLTLKFCSICVKQRSLYWAVETQM